MKYMVFYGIQIHSEYENWKHFREARDNGEIPEGSYVLNTYTRGWFDSHMWSVLEEDIPAELKMLQLLLNL